MSELLLPQFSNPQDIRSVFVANQPAPILIPKSVTSTSWSASGTVSIPSTEAVIYLKSLFGYNKGVAQWLHLFDLSAVPANGVATAVMILALPANGNFWLDVPGPRGMGFITKFVYVVSTTETTLTLGAADIKLSLVMANISGGV